MPKPVPTKPIPDEEEEPELSDLDHVHLYKLTFRRMPRSPKELTSRTKQFVTFGTSEQDAIERVWQAYKGSSFTTDFERETATAEFILGGVFRWGSA
jgi:hypothetical protein